MAPRRFECDDLADVLPAGGRAFVSGASGESLLLAAAVERMGAGVRPAIVTGIFVPNLNRSTYRAGPASRVETFFLTPELKACDGGVDFLPFCYGDILAHLRGSSIDTALMMVSPPDEQGNCSFGCSVDFLAELWPQIPVRIAHINPLMPQTHGDVGIPFSELTAFCDAEQPLLGTCDAEDDATARAIAQHVAQYVGDGATLQIGLGKVPGAILRALVDRRNLKLHSGLIGDGVLDLLKAGALAPVAAITTGVAIGSDRLYREITSPVFQFRPVSTTHNPLTIARIPDFISINSALEVDLYGQAYAECGAKGLMSGPGGATDFASAARIGGGLRIVALPASAVAGQVSRVIMPGQSSGPVSLSRMDVDVFATEYGAAEIRRLGYAARAEALIGIAAPQHRDALHAAWRIHSSKF